MAGSVPCQNDVESGATRGGLIGLPVLGGGVALTGGLRGRLVALVLVAAVTLVAERWSLSKAIEAVFPLRRLGRARSDP